VKTYYVSIDVQPAPTTTPDEALALAVQPVNDLAVVEESSAKPVGGGVVNLRLRFLGLNDNEARETVRRMYQQMRTSGGALRAVDPAVLSGVNL
jgi:hypothetical protein